MARQIILTNWNAGVFKQTSLPQLLPELAVSCLLYDEVLIREEDLLTNRMALRFLRDSGQLSLLFEFLESGLVRLLRAPLEVYPTGRRFDPERLPISARVEEHELRRSYKGRRWKSTAWERSLFSKLDELVYRNPEASRFHAPFPKGNPFADELAELLEHKEAYRLPSHRLFRYIPKETSDAFLRFCREPEAWLRFLVDQGETSPIVGPDGAFFRSAAYQCARHLPAPRSTLRLVESVYAATYCAREDSDGLYGQSELVELPFRYASDAERESEIQALTRVELAPTGAVVNLDLRHGLPEAILKTRESNAFSNLQATLEQIAADPIGASLPTEAVFKEAWLDLCEVFATKMSFLGTEESAVDRLIPRLTVWAYVLSKVRGFVVLPHWPSTLDLGTAIEASAVSAVQTLGPKLLKGFRAMIRLPKHRRQIVPTAEVRCSNVQLNVR